MRKSSMFILNMTVAMVLVQSCQIRHHLDSVHRLEVAPMHITIDVNVNLDKELDAFFNAIDGKESS